MPTPFGLQATTITPRSFSLDLPGVSYDADAQVSMAGGTPVVERPGLLGEWGVTWTDTNNANEK